MTGKSGRDSKSREQTGQGPRSGALPVNGAETPFLFAAGHEGETPDRETPAATDAAAKPEASPHTDRLRLFVQATPPDSSVEHGLRSALAVWTGEGGWTAGFAALRVDDETTSVRASAGLDEGNGLADAAKSGSLSSLFDVAAPEAIEVGSLPDAVTAVARDAGLVAADVFPVRDSRSPVAAFVLLRDERTTVDPQTRQELEIACRILSETASRARAQDAVRGAAKHVRQLAAQVEPARGRLEELEARYALLCRAAEPGLWDWDLDGEKIHYSPRWKSTLGYAATDLSDHPSEWFDRIHADDADRVELELLEHLDWQSPRFESEHRILHADGTYRRVRVRAVAERGEDGTACRVAGSMTDISESRAREDRTARDLMYHRLTGLPTAALMTDRIEQAMRRRSRRPDRSFAVVTVSLDGLRETARRVGSEATEEVMLSLGRRIANTVRPGDTVAHLEDLQFGVLLDDVKNLDDAMKVAERFIGALKQEIPLGTESVTFTPAGGLALSRAAYESPDEILRDSAIALRRARRDEIDVQVFDAATKAYAQTMAELEGDIRKAFEARELFLEYQPVVSLGDGRITGVEAFLRWNHPERGPIAPSEFLPVAEEAGLLQELGYWVTETACRQMREWTERYSLRFPPNIAINVDQAQLFAEDFLPRTVQAIEGAGLDPRLVRFDVSEGTFMKDGPGAGRILRSLTQRGIRIAVDDFGTGFSSLSYLHRYPVGALKIDRSFVSGSAGQSNDWDVARTIIELSRILELEVIAEGIETREQFQNLKKLGCQQAQGYFFSGPVPASKAGALIQEGYPLDLESPVV